MDESLLLLLKTDGTSSTHALEKDSLRQIQRLVGGYITLAPGKFPLRKGYTLSIYADDEGCMKGCEMNPFIKTLVGNVVVCLTNKKGSTIGLTIEEVERVLSKLSQ